MALILMKRLCIICSYPISESDRLTCSDKCLVELNRRKLIASEKRKHERMIRNTKPHRTMNDIVNIVTEGMAAVLLERDIPIYISNADLDRAICDIDSKYSEMNVAYRKRCMSKKIEDVGYATHATSTHGRKTFKLVENKDELRTRLQHIVAVV